MTADSAPAVSVVVANYNYGRHLPGLLRALALQTLGAHRLEVLLCDDGSTDDSLELARAWQAEHPFQALKVLAAAHKGHPAPVRNRGFSNAGGRRLVYVDADDQPAPAFLEALSRALDAGADLAYCANLHHKEGQEQVTLLPPASAELLRTQNVLTSPALMRREVWERSGGFRANTAYEDWDFWVRAAMNGFCFARLEAPLFVYTTHEANFSRQAERQDALAKAAIVLNNEAFFAHEVRRWAQGVQSGAAWAQPLPRGVIPTAAQAAALAGA